MRSGRNPPDVAPETLALLGCLPDRLRTAAPRAADSRAIRHGRRADRGTVSGRGLNLDRSPGGALAWPRHGLSHRGRTPQACRETCCAASDRRSRHGARQPSGLFCQGCAEAGAHRRIESPARREPRWLGVIAEPRLENVPHLTHGAPPAPASAPRSRCIAVRDEDGALGRLSWSARPARQCDLPLRSAPCYEVPIRDVRACR
jgi:hypothetical protein